MAEPNERSSQSKKTSPSRKRSREAASRLIGRMVNAHRQRKREEKIRKLESDSSHWKGLK